MAGRGGTPKATQGVQWEAGLASEEEGQAAQREPSRTEKTHVFRIEPQTKGMRTHSQRGNGAASRVGNSVQLEGRLGVISVNIVHGFLERYRGGWPANINNNKRGERKGRRRRKRKKAVGSEAVCSTPVS